MNNCVKPVPAAEASRTRRPCSLAREAADIRGTFSFVCNCEPASSSHVLHDATLRATTEPTLGTYH